MTDESTPAQPTSSENHIKREPREQFATHTPGGFVSSAKRPEPILQKRVIPLSRPALDPETLKAQAARARELRALKKSGELDEQGEAELTQLTSDPTFKGRNR